MPDMTPTDPSPTPAADVRLPEVRFLKILVTVLTAVMILGLVTIVALLVTRLSGATPPIPVLPQLIKLPEGTQAEAVTIARAYTVVVTDKNTVLLYRADGTLAQMIAISD